MHNLKIPFLIIVCVFSSIAYSQVILNEIQSSNSSTLADNFGEYEDWIEIYNPSNVEIDIGGLVLKDNVDTWQIPLGDTSTILPPKGYFLLWADDEEFQGKFHTNFKLSASNGEFLGLYEADSITKIESVNIPPLNGNTSYGKCGGISWMVYTTPTPLKINDCINSDENLIVKQGVTIYPTITPGTLNVDLLNYSGGQINLNVFSINGKLVFSSNFKSKTFTTDLSHLSSAIYVLKIDYEKYSYSNKIVLNKSE